MRDATGLDAAIQSIVAAGHAAEPGGSVPVGGAMSRPMATEQPHSSLHDWGSRGHDAVLRIPVMVRVVIGAAKMPVSKLMSLTRGSIIPLDRKVGDLVDIVVNGSIVARGEIVVLDQEADRFAVAVREIVANTDDAAG